MSLKRRILISVLLGLYLSIATFSMIWIEVFIYFIDCQFIDYASYDSK